jgi:hypothetical protein
MDSVRVPVSMSAADPPAHYQTAPAPQQKSVELAGVLLQEATAYEILISLFQYRDVLRAQTGADAKARLQILGAQISELRAAIATL